jgi:hypothetical protein
MGFGWIEDPEPLAWPKELRLKRGEVVEVTGVEVLEGRGGLVIGHDDYGDGGTLRYVVKVDGEDTSWALPDENLRSTGAFRPEELPLRIRPVLGDGSVVRIRESIQTRDLGIAGEVALTEGLWWTEGSHDPQGYSVRLPGDRQVHSLFFNELEPVMTG